MNGFVATLEHHKETRVGVMHAFFGNCGSVPTFFLMILSWLTIIRIGCVCGATCINQVRGFSPLVLPLPYVHRGRLGLYRLLFLGLPVQKARWYARHPFRTVARC